ncbi:MAG: bifunctional proline dehydrogenase/L-glutamate gamma-semialdehyde dehydrogenase [Oceanospirillaceae bacterium]|uniref:bifunctional proline dehydrogenase/L-glutamate gamma-semialdehyde dehydrogenase PutA n=1 Tax=unclassified Thalassolituus TaxID=2624967 RepID=UPI000C3EA27F|nr:MULTISPECIES: bifunctional proline dehydrogenase/L-glutamate gamma-semialdehyde dehydrogenase PutA [unclassified Thalassolituus]MAS24278.1 bifunctional proline dehydrogenase/L-glutamate gamma-semialdehyde dehydrogenase [Oceanospirillaceae bacterium]MAX99802.1 bifunctional proline dehydrogenase/L-glutamate gamma-semialdehyde dehydrogenase [Oceanospirillaceae bacterium]MBL36631.1 bifunctional proline dehydrogenase/L-glutamate gamma-semialdehyde dehydrogenase [Oceanospirillaceae bacterium]MBS53
MTAISEPQTISSAEQQLDQLRENIRRHYLADEDAVLKNLICASGFSRDARQQASHKAADLVRRVRAESRPSMMENFLAEYGLSTKEGVALMCLAEALLRVPDSTTMDDLIEDKVAFGEWRQHIGKSASSLVNTSTWALMLTGKLIAPAGEEGMSVTLRGMVKRLGEPVVRTAVGQAMKELGRQFVLGRDIQEATKRAKKLEAEGYTYSYDMLGEAARTAADAEEYLKHYAHAIAALSPLCVHKRIADNPGISVKLSALHPRYEFAKRERVMHELTERTLVLARQAAKANMGFNIDAEEADRLDLSLDVIKAVLADPQLKGWDGFGVVVQAFGQRTAFVIDWLYELAQQLDRRIMVRLVKGAYWDAEIKRAQTLGLDGFPVYTRKVHSDISYLCCAEKLLAKTDRIYPQFATHNAHSIAAVLTMAEGLDNKAFEFQRLHGMGESLHDMVHRQEKTRCRIYAPVGQHKDLLAYLVRRLLENGANSSFVNQIVDEKIAPETIARDPFSFVEEHGVLASRAIARPPELYGEARRNAKGFDITNIHDVAMIEQQRAVFRTHKWRASPMIAGGRYQGDETTTLVNPACPDDVVGTVISASVADIKRAIVAAQEGFSVWSATPTQERAEIIERIADLYEEHSMELFALATREAGKTLADAVGEIREAVDFARYYAQQLRQFEQSAEAEYLSARGVITCISPWNFPLAIFSGQIFAALAAGNSVLAKPADQTPLIAARATELMHQAGVPEDVVQLLPGSGAKVGGPLTADGRIDGVCFTGSTQTAMRINRMMADHMAADAPLIAETGGLNAMLADSTALPEQVVRDVLASAFQSAGQRCSALRILYVQEDIADNLLTMLYGAMDQLQPGNPWQLTTDIGPVIDDAAKQKIENYCNEFAIRGQLTKKLDVPTSGRFVAPAVIRVKGIEEMPEEIFGPVLHVATFRATEVNEVIRDINARGHGLTFGLHTRMDTRIESVTRQIHVGNTYVNRNQIGAIVGSQPFGGEGLSGTGPKAGGPAYLKRFMRDRRVQNENLEKPAHVIGSDALQSAIDQVAVKKPAPKAAAQALLDELHLPARYADVDNVSDVTIMPGPTGESNRLSVHARGVVLCLGPDAMTAMKQAAMALANGNQAVMVATGADDVLKALNSSALPLVALNGVVESEALTACRNFAAVISCADAQCLSDYRKALSSRQGILVPLISEMLQHERYQIERHLCIDTTAAGGNASLIAASE